MDSFFTTPLPPVGYDLIAILVIAYFAWRGKRRGLVRELSSIVAILGSILLAKPFGSLLLPLFTVSNLPGFIATPIELTLGGLAAYLILRITLFLIAKFSGLLKEREGTPQTVIKVGGAITGSLFGILVVLAFGWYILSFGHLSEILMRNPRLMNIGKAEAAEVSTDLPAGVRLMLLPTRMTAAHREPFSHSLSGKLAAAWNPIPDQILEGAEVMVDMTQHPEQLQKLAEFAPVQELAAQPAVQALVGNAEIRALAEKGDYAGLLNHPAVKEVMADPKIQELLKTMDITELKKFLEEQR